MNFQTAVATCFRNYVTFSGRASRPEYWYFFLFSILVSLGLSIVDTAMFGPVEGMGGSNGPLAGLFSLAIFLPSLAVGARRLHDSDRSGWWLLLVLIPVLGFLVLIYFFVQPGTDGPNRFGPGPGRAANSPGAPADRRDSYSRSNIPRVDRDDD